MFVLQDSDSSSQEKVFHSHPMQLPLLRAKYLAEMELFYLGASKSCYHMHVCCNQFLSSKQYFAHYSTLLYVYLMFEIITTK